MKIKGKVIDEKTAETLVGVNVYLSDSNGKITSANLGTTTMATGMYETPDLPDNGFLTASMVGYEPQIASFNQTTSLLNFKLETKSTSLPTAEIVAKPIGKEGQKKKGILPYILIAIGTIAGIVGITAKIKK